MAVMDVDGDATGELMFVRYCSGCWRGLPLHMFRTGVGQCIRCVKGDAAFRLRAESAPRPERALDPATDDLQHSTPATALIMDHAYGPGLCKAKGCWDPVLRHGSGQRNETRPLPMCLRHIKVHTSHLCMHTAACS